MTVSDAVSRGRLAGSNIMEDKAKDVLSSLSSRQSLELFKLLGSFIVSRSKSCRLNERAAKHEDVFLSTQLQWRDTVHFSGPLGFFTMSHYHTGVGSFERKSSGLPNSIGTTRIFSPE